MARADIEYLMLQDVRPWPLTRYGLPLGWLGERLSHDPATGEATYLVQMRPHWRLPTPGIVECGLEILMLAGSCQFGVTGLSRGHYGRVNPGGALGPAGSDEGCSFLLMADRSFRWVEQRASRRWTVENVLSLPWQPAPDFEGRSAAQTPEGVFVKWLHEDSQSGAYTLITRQPGGWSDPKLEAHRCWEELLLLDGDYLMGVNGAVSAGCYIFRNGEIPHGPQASRTGAIWFCRGNARIDFQYSSVPWAQPQIDRYLETARTAGPTARGPAPWGSWRSPDIEDQEKE